MYATDAQWEKRLCVLYDKVRLRGRGLEELAREAGQAGITVEMYDIDNEYERLWLEVPLPRPVSRLLGGRDKAPVALFRNLGWLLSDDWRQQLVHSVDNPGQIAVRLFDWIAMADYAVERVFAPRAPLAFRLVIDRITQTRENPLVEIRPIGATYETLFVAYDWFGIALGKTEEVLARGFGAENA